MKMECHFHSRIMKMPLESFCSFGKRKKNGQVFTPISKWFLSILFYSSHCNNSHSFHPQMKMPPKICFTGPQSEWISRSPKCSSIFCV